MMTNNVKAEGERLKAKDSANFIPHPSSFLLREATHALENIDSPRLTAEVLLAHVLGLSRAQALARLEQKISAEAQAQFEALVARAATGEPLAYLTGTREFCGLEFVVDARVLVPRPETELLVDLAVRLQPGGRYQHILDVGTGSGCIAVTLAVKCPTARITAVDLSAEALAVARRNAERHAMGDRIVFVQSDLLASREAALRHASFDLICANLPYVASDELRTLPVARHEPALALDGGPDGLALIRRLLTEAAQALAPGGRLVLEIGAGQGEAVVALARAVIPAVRVELHHDLAGLERLVAVIL
jgi:release factor glutamine methyltransferase